MAQILYKDAHLEETPPSKNTVPLNLVLGSQNTAVAWAGMTGTTGRGLILDNESSSARKANFAKFGERLQKPELTDAQKRRLVELANAALATGIVGVEQTARCDSPSRDDS
ncbi:MAG: hypothetical protein JSS66_09435 [Armatimonadetes bacterium]|nr:hypothetical protein [Armatimonadota bacterium]